MHWLAEERRRRHLTQTQVAEQMGVSQSYVARLERASGDPRLSTVLRYAAVVVGAAALLWLLREVSRGEAGAPGRGTTGGG